MDRYSSEFQISPKHVVFLSYLHFNVSANALVLNNKIFFLFLVLGLLRAGYAGLLPTVWTDITQQKEDVEQQVIIFIIVVCLTKYENIFTSVFYFLHNLFHLVSRPFSED